MPPNSKERCPICRTTLAVYDPKKVMRNAGGKGNNKQNSAEGVPDILPLVMDILGSEKVDTKKIVDIINKAKLHFSDAEILVRYSNNEHPVEIARSMDISLNRVIKVTEFIRNGGGVS
jgi:hypothetical protein